MAVISTKHYLWAGNVLILGLVVWSAVGFGMSVLEKQMEGVLPDSGPTEIQRRAVSRKKSLSQYESIIKSNIFGGNADKTPASKPVKSTPGQTTFGNYRLRGTVIDPEQRYVAAILEDTKTGEQHLYRPGDDIDGAKLVRVERSHATLRHDGREIRLEIYMDEGPAAPTRGRPRPTVRTSRTGDSKETIAQDLGDNRYVISRETLSKHLDNLNSFMSSVRIMPYFKDGEAHGFKVAAVRRNSPVSQLGIQRGDIIMSVNDVGVGKPEDLVNLYRQLQQLDTITIDIERRGSPLTLTYSLR